MNVLGFGALYLLLVAGPALAASYLALVLQRRGPSDPDAQQHYSSGGGL